MRMQIILLMMFTSTVAAGQTATPYLTRPDHTVCPSGYTSNAGGCTASPNAHTAFPKPKGQNCPSGTYSSGDFCQAYH